MIQGDPYANLAILVSIELVSVICSQIALQKLTRKVPYTLGLAFASISFMCKYITPKCKAHKAPSFNILWFESLRFSAKTNLIFALELLSKFLNGFTINFLYVVQTEMYPTVVRGSMLTFNMCLGYIGGALAPYINLLVTKFASIDDYLLKFALFFQRAKPIGNSYHAFCMGCVLLLHQSCFISSYRKQKIARSSIQ